MAKPSATAFAGLAMSSNAYRQILTANFDLTPALLSSHNSSSQLTSGTGIGP
jgi:hypothetical protein